LEAREYYQEACRVTSNFDTSVMEEIDKTAGELWGLVTFKFPEDNYWVTSVRKPVDRTHPAARKTAAVKYDNQSIDLTKDKTNATDSRVIERKPEPFVQLSKTVRNILTRRTHALANTSGISRNDNA
jgi:hypothetical protein